MTDFTCRLCHNQSADILQSFDDWIAFAAGQDDERAQIAAIVKDNPALNFGDIIRCESCGLASVASPPTPDALGEFYDAYYASDMYSTKRDKKIKRAKSRVRRLSRLTQGRRFLDVGSNLGFACEGARQMGFTATGIEIDAEAVKSAKNNFILNDYHWTSVEEFAERGGQFDIVYCSEVIEHAINFTSFADALLKLVAPGGLLYLTTPAADHKKTPRPLVSWVQVKPPEHLTWFGQDHLRRLFDKPGFDLTFTWNIKPGHKIIVRRR